MRYRIGIDGGGSKTESILIDPAGRIVGRRLGAGCNPSIVGTEAARTTVAGELGALAAEASALTPGAEIAAVLLCMAGSGAFWREFAAELTGFGRAVAVDDSLPVLELATAGGPGLVLHAGTGSFVAARAAPGAPGPEAGPFGAVRYAGGLGWKLGDPGSGYDIGRRAAARALLELQGWAPPSGLSALLRRHTGLAGDREIKAYLYSAAASVATLADLAPAVLDLAEGGDAAALAVAGASGQELLDLAHEVAARIFPGIPGPQVRAGLSGRILVHPAMRRVLAPLSRLTLHPVEAAPIEGVRRLLLGLR